MRLLVIMLTILIGTLSPAIGAKTNASQGNTSNNVPLTPPLILPAATLPNELTKEGWVANMQKTLPKLLCQSDEYFMQCYTVTAKECQEFTSLLVKACLNNVVIALPTLLDQQQGEYWGQRIGRCSYDLYHKFMAPKKRDSDACKQITTKNYIPKPTQAKP